jgi:alcohol dehydrogenase (NADP+)
VYERQQRCSPIGQVHDFVLSAADMSALEALDKGYRYCVPKIVVDGQTVARDGDHPHYPFNAPY